jgi:hypothetical protein
MRSCGAERKLNVVAGKIPEFLMIITRRGEKRVKQVPRFVLDEHEQFIISRGADDGDSRSRVSAVADVD